MNAANHRRGRRQLLAVLTVCAALSPLQSTGAQSSARRNPVPSAIHIELLDGQGTKVSEVTQSRPTPALPAVVPLQREYMPGDRITISGPQRMAIKVGEGVPECVVYLGTTAPFGFRYDIPQGRAEAQTGSAYDPAAFAGEAHRIAARPLSAGERSSYRNLALNPCDARQPEDAPAVTYPHATTNSVSRSLFDFEARNAIDGGVQNGHHGVWPYQSWGPQLRLDLWWKLDFGRPVQLDKVRLMVRSDFPHDSYWKNADIEFSDGSHETVQIAESGAMQEFAFAKRKVTWLRLTNLVPADPARWCALMELEAWGIDLP